MHTAQTNRQCQTGPIIPHNYGTLQFDEYVGYLSAQKEVQTMSKLKVLIYTSCRLYVPIFTESVDDIKKIDIK
jgi:hypothetical protein